MTLGYSRKSVHLLVFRSSSQVWACLPGCAQAELHEKAFRRLGGSPRVVVLDNVREGVLAADIYDPTLNPLYEHVLLHYGVVATPACLAAGRPCRIKDADRKAYVSYCTLFRAFNVESWLLGLPASLAPENSIVIQRFV